MRLRLEPTINVTIKIAIHSQIDVFDNHVMGSTPEGYYLNGLPAGAGTNLAFLSSTAATTKAGINSFSDAVSVKRAWGEVKTAIGNLSFGIMPNHWGTGMLFNDGNCLDCNYGSTVDRVAISTNVWGHFFAFFGTG